MRVRGHTFWAIALPRSACRGASRGARASLWRHEERTGASGKGQIDTSVKRNRALSVFSALGPRVYQPELAFSGHRGAPARASPRGSGSA